MSSTGIAVNSLAEQHSSLYEALAPNGHRVSVGRIPVPSPIPIPIPLIAGSRFLIWKQDPTVRDVGVRAVFLPGLVVDGPRDSRIVVELVGTTPVHGSVSRDYVFVPGSLEFDCAHTFAVVRETLTMYQRIRGTVPIPWAWNTAGNVEPITVSPRAGVTANAFYSRGQKALKFFYFTPAGATQPVFTCRSLDIVSHECGHAVLDGLKPGWLTSGNPPQTGGLHESFGDLTALFLACSQLDQVDAAIALTKADLHTKNFLAALAEQFGAALGFPQGLRNADNDLRLSQVSNEVHAIAQVFTGAIYDVMADIFTFEKRRQAKDPARVLLEVASNLNTLLVDAIVAAPGVGATYVDVANQMLSISSAKGDPPIYRTFIRNRFTLREIVVSATPLRAVLEGKINYDDPDFVEGGDVVKMQAQIHASDRAPQDRSACCGTMQLPEYTLGDSKKLRNGVGITQDDLVRSDTIALAKAFQ